METSALITKVNTTLTVLTQAENKILAQLQLLQDEEHELVGMIDSKTKEEQLDRAMMRSVVIHAIWGVVCSPLIAHLQLNSSDDDEVHYPTGVNGQTDVNSDDELDSLLS
jgi:hypothetical protein